MPSSAGSQRPRRWPVEGARRGARRPPRHRRPRARRPRFASAGWPASALAVRQVERQEHGLAPSPTAGPEHRVGGTDHGRCSDRRQLPARARAVLKGRRPGASAPEWSAGCPRCTTAGSGSVRSSPGRVAVLADAVERVEIAATCFLKWHQRPTVVLDGRPARGGARERRRRPVSPRPCRDSGMPLRQRRPDAADDCAGV